MPMDFKFTEEQELFRRTVQKFCEDNIKPKIKELFKEKMLTKDVHDALTKQGLLSLLIPPEYGGQGADFISFIIAVEELAKVDLSVVASFAMGYHSTCSLTLSRYATDKLKEEVLPRIAKDGWMIDIHVTEPGCGTDFTAITTVAKKTDGGYVINGEKQFVSLIPDIMTYGGGFMTAVKTAPELGGRGMSVIFVPYNAKGLEPTKFEGMGLELGGMKYENVEVPDYYLLGKEGQGYPISNESFIFSRIPVTMCMVGAALGAVQTAIEYAKQREAFGRPIAAFGMLQYEMADDVANLEAARLLTYKAAWTADRYLKGEASLAELTDIVAKAKLFASKYAINALHHALEWCGALGLTAEYDLQMAYRSARMLTVAEGSMNAMRIIISIGAIGREFIPWRWGPKK